MFIFKLSLQVCGENKIKRTSRIPFCTLNILVPSLALFLVYLWDCVLFSIPGSPTIVLFVSSALWYFRRIFTSQQWLTKYVSTAGLAKVFLQIATLYLKRSVSHENCLCAVNSGCVGGVGPRVLQLESVGVDSVWPLVHTGLDTEIGDHGPAPPRTIAPWHQSTRGRTTGYTNTGHGNIDMGRRTELLGKTLE